MAGMAEAEKQMKKTVEGFRSEIAALRTGRASLTLLEGVKVEYYGSKLALNQVANLSVSEARTIEIKPWDAGVLPEVEKAINKANIGLTPNNDGKLIRLNIPKLTEERRRELVKTVKKTAETYRVSVRNIRRDAIEAVKKSEKEKAITEDDRKGAEHSIQRLTDVHVKQIDEMLAHKEKEIMEV